VTQLITQYVLIIFLILGFGYLIYLLKDKEPKGREDYYGIAYGILNTLQPKEATTENVKKIIRAVAEAVNYVELNYKDDDNSFKEEKALNLSRTAINALNFSSDITDESMRYIIRLVSVTLPPIDKTF